MMLITSDPLSYSRVNLLQKGCPSLTELRLSDNTIGIAGIEALCNVLSVRST